MERKSSANLITDIFLKTYEKIETNLIIERNITISDQENILTIFDEEFYLRDFDKIYVVGTGLTVLEMARHMENILKDRISGGIILLPEGLKENLRKIQVREVTSPLLDRESDKALKDLLYILNGARKNDLIIALFSKGTEEILENLREGIKFRDYSLLVKQLKEAGASPREIDSVKMHFSTLKGGGLLRNIYPATTIALYISDRPGNDVDNTFLAPTHWDSSTFKDCRQILIRHNLALKIPEEILHYFNQGMQGKIPETLKSADEQMTKIFNFALASPLILAKQAEIIATQEGFDSAVLSSYLEGPPIETGAFLGKILKEMCHSGNPITPPGVLIASGRLSMTDESRINECCEAAIGAAIAIEGIKGTSFLAGTSFTYEEDQPVACFVDGNTIDKIKKTGADPATIAEYGESRQILEKIGALIRAKSSLNDCGDIFILSATDDLPWKKDE